MPYHDELLTHALDLIHKDPQNPKQADVRSAVSAAYYSLFHLLISELVELWGHAESKSALARMPQHRAMVEASRRVQQMPFAGEDPTAVQSLKTVARALVQLHDNRERADYDTGFHWVYTEASSEVMLAATAFEEWRSIRTTSIAQAYVASLLLKSPRSG